MIFKNWIEVAIGVQNNWLDYKNLIISSISKGNRFNLSFFFKMESSGMKKREKNPKTFFLEIKC